MASFRQNPHSLVFICSLMIQLHISACLPLLLPPQKYSVPTISRKELISELQELSKKVAEMRSKWYNKAQHSGLKELLSAQQQQKLATTPMPKFTPGTDLLKVFHHRPSPSEISLGIFNPYKSSKFALLNLEKEKVKNSKEEAKSAGPEMVDHGEKKTVNDPEVDTTFDENLDEILESISEDKDDTRLDGQSTDAIMNEMDSDEEIETRPANIRDCLFLRSGCTPARRMDWANTSAYLDKVQALMNSAA
ncbi:hypothetical protein DdX_12424 [Ditylenchus destructor]|uniref:Uncharacterized protein n=1 Tax=Ditylenchus destructor TaxID=166010 RepID=A0AAD4QXF3_9BILA|nr:hypothetical protein DdX_12424 [Ditylenchus destructor]